MSNVERIPPVARAGSLASATSLGAPDPTRIHACGTEDALARFQVRTSLRGSGAQGGLRCITRTLSRRLRSTSRSGPIGGDNQPRPKVRGDEGNGVGCGLYARSGPSPGSKFEGGERTRWWTSSAGCHGRVDTSRRTPSTSDASTGWARRGDLESDSKGGSDRTFCARSTMGI